MALLTPSAVHIDQPLTNLTIAYTQDQSNFVADKVFPVIGVDKQSDKYHIYNRAEQNRSGEVVKLSSRTEIPRVDMTLSTDAYYAELYGLAMDFDPLVLANADEHLELRSAGAAQLVNKMLIHREKQWVDSFFKTGIWTTEYTGAAASSATEFVKWSDSANATPIQDVLNAQRAMQLKSGGYRPNTMVVSKEVRDTLLHVPNILERLNGGATITNTALVTDAKLAEVFDVENFLVMEAIENTAAEGLEESNAFIGGNNVLLTYKPSNVGRMSAVSGATFAWNAVEGASGLGITVESFTGDYLRIRGVEEQIQVKMAYDMKVTGADLGVFISDII